MTEIAAQDLLGKHFAAVNNIPAIRALPVTHEPPRADVAIILDVEPDYPAYISEMTIMGSVIRNLTNQPIGETIFIATASYIEKNDILGAAYASVHSQNPSKFSVAEAVWL